MDMKYYKFRECTENNLDTLSRSCIYAASCQSFNDPYEGVCWVDAMAVKYEQVKNQSLLVHNKQRLNNRGFYCVASSENTDYLACEGLLMWVHYADAHKGYCVQYNERLLEGLEKDSLERGYCKMEYTDDMPYLPEDNDISFMNVIKTKSKCWESENETRLIYRGQGLKSINTDAIDAIYLGCMISDSNKSRLVSIAQRLGVQCFQMELRNDRRELKVSPVFFE